MPRKTQFTADDVVVTTYDMVRKNGWEGLTVTAVAKQMGCSTMPIYSHFDSLEMLKDEVVRKGWALIIDYESKQYTGDVWVDQAIGYVRFAQKEKNLFICMFDGRNLKLQRKMLREHWSYLSRLLDDYEAFSGLDEKQCMRIRYSRGMLTHGVATSIINGWGFLFEGHEVASKNDEILSDYLTTASQVLLKGYKEVTTD
jgi:AcrR family transcriptional regulator